MKIELGIIKRQQAHVIYIPTILNLTPTDMDQYAIPNFSIVSWKCSSLVIPLKRRDSDVVPW